MNHHNAPLPQPRFEGVCLVTRDVGRLRAFYEMLLGIEGEGDDQHVQLSPAGASLTIFSTRGMEEMAPGSMAGAGIGSTILGFELSGGPAAIDAAHARLLELDIPIVKPPETYPWGTRSVWFRDPDGNIVNVYARTVEGA